jgi:hypothetical protein
MPRSRQRHHGRRPSRGSSDSEIDATNARALVEIDGGGAGRPSAARGRRRPGHAEAERRVAAGKRCVDGRLARAGRRRSSDAGAREDGGSGGKCGLILILISFF